MSIPTIIDKCEFERLVSMTPDELRELLSEVRRELRLCVPWRVRRTVRQVTWRTPIQAKIFGAAAALESLGVTQAELCRRKDDCYRDSAGLEREIRRLERLAAGIEAHENVLVKRMFNRPACGLPSQLKDARFALQLADARLYVVQESLFVQALREDNPREPGALYAPYYEWWEWQLPEVPGAGAPPELALVPRG